MRRIPMVRGLLMAGGFCLAVAAVTPVWADGPDPTPTTDCAAGETGTEAYSVPCPVVLHGWDKDMKADCDSYRGLGKNICNSRYKVRTISDWSDFGCRPSHKLNVKCVPATVSNPLFPGSEVPVQVFCARRSKCEWSDRLASCGYQEDLEEIKHQINETKHCQAAGGGGS